MSAASKNTSRIAIRAALQSAGILTERGEIAGPLLESADAAIFVLIEQYQLAWGAYTAWSKKGGMRRTTREKCLAWHREAERCEADLACTRATTIEGARAKAQLVLDQLTNCGRTEGGPLFQLIVSAIRDALRGPDATLAKAARVRTSAANVVDLAQHRSAIHSDAKLQRLLEDLATQREVGRLDEPLSSAHSSDAWVAAARAFVQLQNQIAALPAATPVGIIGKLQAAMPRGDWRAADLPRSAIRDLLAHWEAWA